MFVEYDCVRGLEVVSFLDSLVYEERGRRPGELLMLYSPLVEEVLAATEVVNYIDP